MTSTEQAVEADQVSANHGRPPEAAAAPQADAGTPNASRSLLTHSLPARNGNPMDTQNPRPANAITHGECGRWWTGTERSHASCCHRTFSSLSAFEAHRRGGQCNDPATVGLIAREKPFGELWGWPAPDGGYTFHELAGGEAVSDAE